MKPRRICLESADREAYISFVRTGGVIEITARCKNRYIDEFLRFCSARFRHSEAERVTSKQLEAFAVHLRAECVNANTAKTKLAAVLRWLKWLSEAGRIEKDPGRKLSGAGLMKKHWP